MGVGRCGEEGRGEVLGWEVGYGGGGGGGGNVKEDIDPRGVEEHGAKQNKNSHKPTTNSTISIPAIPHNKKALRLEASILAYSVTETPPLGL